MKTEIKLIKAFIQEKKPMTIREAGKKIKADYKITHTAMQRLLKKQIINAQTIGKSTLCSLNPCYYGVEIYLAEEERKQELLKNHDIKQLYKEIITKIRTSLFIMIIFGSYANKKNNKHSDIDLLFISNEKGFEEKINNIAALLPLKIHAQVFTEKEFSQMKESNNPNIIQEAIQNNVIFYGTESYYKLKND